MLRIENLPKKQHTCPHCKRAFKAPVVNPLKASVEVLPCDRCGEPAVLEFFDEVYGWFLKRPASVSPKVELEDALLPCQCGGRARRDAPQRCPDCKKPLEEKPAPSARREAVPLIGEARQSPRVWDRGSEPLRDELSRSALYCVEPGGARFAEACLALPALALLDPERAFSLLRQALAANPGDIDEERWYSDEDGQTLFTLTVSLLTAALNGGGRQVLPYVASQLSSGDRRWISFLLEAMRESDQLNRMTDTSWLLGGKGRAEVEAQLRAG